MKFRVVDTRTGIDVTESLYADEFQREIANADWSQNLVWCDLEDWAVGTDGVLFLMDECGNVAYVPDYYRVEPCHP